ncbi:YtxH domain-containing protein [Cohnella caldifontis]|uniref:YtxH domain-containing protein n=1 Tax=Cohnella caldifontis TaxID=3027471 RepID=UPI0023ED51D8|nr:YtxH domain-containing protein [Cohnella sp. YIM B05605]
MADKKVVKSFMWGALTGAVTGAVSALLLAPKSGKELRKDIAVTAQKIGDKTADAGRQAGAAVQSFAKRTSEVASEAKQAAGRFVTDIRSYKGAESESKEKAAESSAIQSTEEEETYVAK